MEDKLLDKSVTYMSYDIGIDPITKNMRKVLVSPSGTSFIIMSGNTYCGHYQLNSRLTEKYRLKFVLENPFEPDKIFDCTEDVTLNAIAWIIERETRDIRNEIS